MGGTGGGTRGPAKSLWHPAGGLVVPSAMEPGGLGCARAGSDGTLLCAPAGDGTGARSQWEQLIARTGITGVCGRAVAYGLRTFEAGQAGCLLAVRACWRAKASAAKQCGRPNILVSLAGKLNFLN